MYLNIQNGIVAEDFGLDDAGPRPTQDVENHQGYLVRLDGHLLSDGSQTGLLDKLDLPDGLQIASQRILVAGVVGRATKDVVKLVEAQNLPGFLQRFLRIGLAQIICDSGQDLGRIQQVFQFTVGILYLADGRITAFENILQLTFDCRYLLAMCRGLGKILISCGEDHIRIVGELV